LLHLPDDYPSDKLPYITGGGLEGRYNFVQLHFHWGSDASQGSEHNIQFRSYPAELHIVHYNTKYRSFPDATSHNDGLAVLGILMEMEARDNVALRHIVELFPQILVEGLEMNVVSPIPLQDLLPDNTDNFYRYHGSLVRATYCY
jgi:carbonic anhydrase